MSNIEIESVMVADPLDRHIGAQIRNLRKKAALNQAALAVATGVSIQQISKYESLMNRVSAAQLWRIAKVLKVEIAAFFEGYEQ